jgi:hypothetical protein
VLRQITWPITRGLEVPLTVASQHVNGDHTCATTTMHKFAMGHWSISGKEYG